MTPTYTHKTKHGHLARIICDNLVDMTYPIVVAMMRDGCEQIHRYTADLKYDFDGESEMDLVEYSPWDGVAVDTKVYVRNDRNESWIPRHFSHYNDGKVYTFDSGSTSWSNSEETVHRCSYTTGWTYAKLAD
jgi:hypothetical protein